MSVEVILEDFALFVPAIVFGALFAWSYHTEPRQFRNALFFLLFVMLFGLACAICFEQDWLFFAEIGVFALAPVVMALFLAGNTVLVVKREGLSLPTLLPAIFAAGIAVFCVLCPVALFMVVPSWLESLLGLAVVEGLYLSFTFVALLVYSWLYRRIPRNRHYDFIVVHGASLSGTRPTPLLAGRLDKSVELWEAQGRRARIVVSGGQGADEEVSEAQAMRDYLVEQRDVPASAIILEDKSTTTMENVRFSKAIMDELSGGVPYRCAVVTSDYHVFRTAEYAHKAHLRADGIGSKTAKYYWPTAFIREFIAVTVAHKWPFVALAVLWAIGVILELVGVTATISLSLDAF